MNNCWHAGNLLPLHWSVYNFLASAPKFFPVIVSVLVEPSEFSPSSGVIFVIIGAL